MEVSGYGRVRTPTPSTLMGYLLVHGYEYRKTYIPTYAATMVKGGIQIKIPTHNSPERDSIMLRAIRLLSADIDKSVATIVREMEP